MKWPPFIHSIRFDPRGDRDQDGSTYWVNRVRVEMANLFEHLKTHSLTQGYFVRRYMDGAFIQCWIMPALGNLAPIAFANVYIPVSEEEPVEAVVTVVAQGGYIIITMDGGEYVDPPTNSIRRYDQFLFDPSTNEITFCRDIYNGIEGAVGFLPQTIDDHDHYSSILDSRNIIWMTSAQYTSSTDRRVETWAYEFEPTNLNDFSGSGVYYHRDDAYHDYRTHIAIDDYPWFTPGADLHEYWIDFATVSGPLYSYSRVWEYAHPTYTGDGWMLCRMIFDFNRGMYKWKWWLWDEETRTFSKFFELLRSSSQRSSDLYGSYNTGDYSPFLLNLTDYESPWKLFFLDDLDQTNGYDPMGGDAFDMIEVVTSVDSWLGYTGAYHSDIYVNYYDAVYTRLDSFTMVFDKIILPFNLPYRETKEGKWGTLEMAASGMAQETSTAPLFGIKTGGTTILAPSELNNAFNPSPDSAFRSDIRYYYSVISGFSYTSNAHSQIDPFGTWEFSCGEAVSGWYRVCFTGAPALSVQAAGWWKYLETDQYTPIFLGYDSSWTELYSDTEKRLERVTSESGYKVQISGVTYYGGISADRNGVTASNCYASVSFPNQETVSDSQSEYDKVSLCSIGNIVIIFKVIGTEIEVSKITLSDTGSVLTTEDITTSFTDAYEAAYGLAFDVSDFRAATVYAPLEDAA